MMMRNQDVDEMAAAQLEQFEEWASTQPNGDSLLERMELVDWAVSQEQSLGVEECWAFSRAALEVASAASRVVGFESIAVMYRTIARLFGVAAVARRGER